MIEPRPWPGKPITEPGIYAGVPMHVYHGPNLCDAPSISSSGLRKIFTHSPAKYWATSPYNPNRVEEDAKEAFVLGRAAHHLFLGEEGFNKEFIARPEMAPDGRQWHHSNDTCKKWMAAAELAGKTVIAPKQFEQLKGMARGLAANPLVRAGILDGLIEQTIVHKDPETGVWVKIRPDVVQNDAGDFGDLKTTTEVTLDKLERTIGELAYPMQAALVAEGCLRVLGRELSSFNLIFVEKTEPFCCEVVTLKPDEIREGHDQNHAAIRAFAHGVKNSQWLGPGGSQNDARYISQKPWQRQRNADRLAQLNREYA